ELDIPLKVGTVGGQVESNEAVRITHQLMDIQSATGLAGVMGAVGLAQNFSAIRALSTDGIQRGHMTLHARSVATAAEVDEAHFEQVVEELISCGDIKVWKAREIMESIGTQMRDQRPQ